MRTFVVLAHSPNKICRCFIWMYDPPIHPQWITQLPLTYQETPLMRHTVNEMWLPCFLSKCSTVTLELQLYCVTKKYPQLKYRLRSLLEMWIIFSLLTQEMMIGRRSGAKRRLFKKILDWSEDLLLHISYVFCQELTKSLYGRCTQTVTVNYLLKMPLMFFPTACTLQNLNPTEKTSMVFMQR